VSCQTEQAVRERARKAQQNEMMFTGGRGVDREKGTAWLDCKNGEATAVRMRRARCSMYSKVLRLGLARVGEFGGGRPHQTQTGVAQ
jgi:hypothetical protein